MIASARRPSSGRRHCNHSGDELPAIRTADVGASIIDFRRMTALRAGGHLVHALKQDHSIAGDLEASTSRAKRIEPQASRADGCEEHRFGRAHSAIIDADKVVCIEAGDCHGIRANERDRKRIVDGANALTNDIGVAWGARSTLGVACADGANAEQEPCDTSEAP